MIKKLKKNLVSTFMLIMTAAILVAPLTAYAAFTQKSRVMGKKLAQWAGWNGRILTMIMYLNIFSACP